MVGGKIVHEIAQQLHQSGEQVALLALLDASASSTVERRSAPVRPRRLHQASVRAGS